MTDVFLFGAIFSHSCVFTCYLCCIPKELFFLSKNYCREAYSVLLLKETRVGVKIQEGGYRKKIRVTEQNKEARF